MDGVLLLPPNADDVIALSDSAAAIWEQLAAVPVTAEEIVATLLHMYDLTPSSLAAEVDALLARLAKQGATRCSP